MSRLTTETHPLINPAIVQKLNKKNIHSLQQFLDADIKILTTAINLTYKNVLTIKKHILNKNAALTRTADEYYKELLKKTAIISTGFESLDLLLGGGFYTGQIYEICGLPSSGKTQFCLSLLAKCASDYNQTVLYIDTKNDFSPCRLKQYLRSDNLEVAFKKIFVNQVQTIFELINVLYEVKDQFLKNRLRLIIIDSLPVLIYQISSIERSNYLINCLTNIMRFIANEFQATFVVTNLITTWRESCDFQNGDLIEKIGCGKFWLNVPNVRIKLDYNEENFKATLLKSNQIKEGTICNFQWNH